jgi:hypothetical protein
MTGHIELVDTMPISGVSTLVTIGKLTEIVSLFNYTVTLPSAYELF